MTTTREQRKIAGAGTATHLLLFLALAFLFPPLETSMRQTRGKGISSGARFAFKVLTGGRVSTRTQPTLLLRGGSSDSEYGKDYQPMNYDLRRSPTPPHGWRYFLGRAHAMMCTRPSSRCRLQCLGGCFGSVSFPHDSKMKR
jgi:hypothetical protein